MLSSDPMGHPDSPDFVYHANGIIAGQYPDREIRGVFSFRAPLYPFVLSVFLRLFGDRLVLVTLFQAIAGVVLVYLIYLFARRLFDEGAAQIAGLSAAVYPHLVEPIRHVQTESVFTLLVFAGTLWFTGTVAGEDRGDARRLAWAATAGIAYGLAILWRPSAMLMVVIFGGWVLWAAALRIRAWRAALVPFVVFLVAAGCVVLPWTVRNYVRFSELILVNNQAGEIFWLGNNPRYFDMHRAKTQEEFSAILKKMGEEQPAPSPGK